MTLTRARAKSDTQIFFITGADAFAEITTWSRYPAVLDLANFVVVSRPGITLDSLRARVPSAFRDRQSASTRVILVEAHTPDISSTDIGGASAPATASPVSCRIPSPATSRSIVFTLETRLHGKDH
jgi:nicotinic acid mononucleotide adenylyltransferase